MSVIIEDDDMLDFSEYDHLMHIGVKRRSGRYPWGSGEEPYQHGMDFLARYEKLKKEGKSDTEIAKELNMLNDKGEPSTGILRLEKKYANDMRKIHQMQRAQSLKDDGLGPTEIGRKMGINESSVRALLDPGAQGRATLAAKTADFLRDQCDKKGMIDVGVNVEKELSSMDLTSYDICRELNISKERLDEALYILKKEGYEVYSGRFDQVTNPGQKTTQKVLCPPGTPHKEIYNLEKVHTITEYQSKDGGNTFDTFQYPASLDSKRLKVLLRDEVGPDGETGVDKDGIIQIRRGVPDLSLGTDRYCQVRILVDNDKYLKGMAVYSDNMPDGVDVIFNSNKTNYEKALKPIKKDDKNPFGSLIKANGQSTYIDADGNEKLSLINKRASEGDWSDWTDALPSQFLSKQAKPMVKQQLDIAKADKQSEFDNIMELNNPTLRKHFLEKFADSCDAAAVDLKAAALPGQKYHVIIPINTLKDNEIYAPQYDNGTKLALIRYPHAGTFEIPILTVNNKHNPAKNIIGTDAGDAVGINKKNADRLSGADFDGDTVMCIPTHDPKGRVKITSVNPEHDEHLSKLIGFDPQMEYPARPGMKYMKNPITGTDATQAEMGKISNLITDMTLFGAPSSDIVKAVKHSMVVIDAAKHNLDYKRSEEENDIKALKKKWQGDMRDDNGMGAATIVSKAKGQATVNRRQGTPKINLKGKEWYDPSRPEGALIYKDADDLWYPVRQYDKDTGTITVRTKNGKKISYNVKDDADREMYEPIKRINDDGSISFTNKAGDIEYKAERRTQASTNMAETDNAYSLVSKARHPVEILYADYANEMKAMANKARIELSNTNETAYNAAAKRTYSAEVDSLMNKLNSAQLNSVRERAAQRKANIEVSVYKESDPTLKKADIRKKGQQAISAARVEVGSIKRRDRNIDITEREWEAIQAGAISKTKLKQILNNSDVDKLREMAMPKTTKSLNASQISRVKQLAANGYTLEQIAKKVGKSPSTVSEYLKGGK